jgi:hypothetical protein
MGQMEPESNRSNHQRERGALPVSEEALVGTYLKSLPDDGWADSANEKTPTVE